LNLVFADLPVDAVAAARALTATEFLGGTALEGGMARLEGYATDEGVSQLQALGATVTIVKSSAQLKADLLALFGEPEPPVV
jgi:hypothetical protein